MTEYIFTEYTKGKVVCKYRTSIQAGLMPIFLTNHFFLSISDPDADDQGFSVSVTYTPPVLYLKSTFNVNDKWTTTTDLIYEEDGKIETYSVTYNFLVMAIEEVTVPAGTFQNCYKISIDVTSSNSDFNENITIWLAENVGIVRNVTDGSELDFTDELQYSSIDGTVHGQEIIN